MSSTRIPPLDGADAELFAAARLRAARCQPYLAAALFAMVPVRTPGLGTFAVDRYWRLYLDPDAAHRWGVAGAAAVLVHEAHHLVRDHHGRAARAGVTDRTMRMWNYAADAAINDDLVADGLELPDPVLPRHLGCRPDGLEEGYFRALVERRRSSGAGHGSSSEGAANDAISGDRAGPDCDCGSGSGGRAHPQEIDDEPTGADEGLDQIDVEVVRRSVAHDIAAAVDGGHDVPPSMVRWARSVLEPKVPWVTLLRAVLGRELRAAGRHAEPTWARPDRRADCSPGVLRPGRRRTGVRVAVVLDTSASMDARLLDAATTEIDALLHRAGARPLPVVVCDHEAAAPQTIRRLGDLRLDGGRGTDLRVGIEVAAALRPTPGVIVVLTDGLTPWPSRAPARTSLVAVIVDSARRMPAEPPRGPGIHVVRVDLDDG